MFNFFRSNYLFDFSGVNNLSGSRWTDYVFGFGGDDLIHGDGGSDHLFGGAGDDNVFGGAGNDRIYGGTGNDSLFGGEGSDRIYGGRGDDVIGLENNGNVAYGGQGIDQVYIGGSISDFDISPFGRVGNARLTELDEDGNSIGVNKLYSIEEVYFAQDDYTYFLDGRNNAALAADDQVDVSEDGPSTIHGSDLLSNDQEFDGDILTIVDVDGQSANGASISLLDGDVIYDAGDFYQSLGAGETATDSFTYVVDDAKGGTDSATVDVTIVGENDAPDFLGSYDLSIDENTIGAVAAITALDVDGDTLSYSISGGADAALFDIDALTGDLSFVAAPDFEAPVDADANNVYEVQVTADDGNAGSATQDITVAVNDVAETPAIAARINEFHYDNASSDVGEFIEVRVNKGDDVSNASVVLYNGNNGTAYNTLQLADADAFTTNDADYDYYVFNLPSNGLQNGSPDGLALVNGTEVLEFLSYEGEMTAADGPAAGMISSDIGTSETGSALIGESLQRGEGDVWDDPRAETKGGDNSGILEFDGRINEFHYDNAGSDIGEFIEVRASEGVDMSGVSLALYNGSNGTEYNTLQITDATSQQSSGGYTYYVFDLPSNGLQNGSPDGIALVNGSEVVEFISYEGSMTATDGVAIGLVSTDIGVAETGSTAIGDSLQRQEGDTWDAPRAETKGGDNAVSVPFEGRINEFHYDNASSDVGEFIELRVVEGADISDVTLALYNGSNNGVYDTLTASDITSQSSSDGYTYYVFDLPANGLQNGPDGIALVNGSEVVEFLSYEGVLTAADGPALGMSSTDIGVAEDGSTLVGDSLQRLSGDIWDAPRAETKGDANEVVIEPGGPALISSIQGAGSASLMVGTSVTVTAVVVGDFQNDDADASRSLGGFYLQEEDADADGDALTSEGIFVFDSGFGVDVNLGDTVTVTGVVTEYFGETQLGNITSVTVNASGTTMPTAASLSLPSVGTVVDGNGKLVPDLEAYEGMLVEFPQTLTITEMFQLDRFNEIKLSEGGQLEQFTQNNAPDVDGYNAHLEDIGARTIVYDDGLNQQNQVVENLDGFGPDFDTASDIRMGDTIDGLSGVLSYQWAGNSSSQSTWRVRSTENGENSFDKVNTRDDAPADVGGDLKVASFNVLNFFTTIDDGTATSGPSGLEPRGADSVEEYERQLEKLVTTLTEMDADVLGLVELENEFGGDQNGDGVYAIDALVTALNEATSPGTYAFVDPGTTFVDTSDAISVGVVYKTASVTPVAGSVEILTDSDLAGLGGDYGTGAVFDGESTNRAPMAVTFTENATGHDFTVAVTHMKSKGGSGAGNDADAGDGAGNYNETRTEGVNALTDWLATFADEDTLVLGDFNAYAKEDPVTAMTDAGYTDLDHALGGGQSSYVFDGQAGTLDYAFASGDIMDNVTGVTTWDINSSEPDALDYNTDFGRDTTMFDGTEPYRTSDHDPIIIGLDLTEDVFVFG